MRTPQTLFILSCFCVLSLSGQDGKDQKETPEAPEPQKPAATLDIKNSAEGSYPGGATPKAGKWSVDAGAKKLKVAPEPLVEARIEFGPEIREKGATIQASARGPSSGRIQSRFGVGLYGKNGFQLRVVPATDTIEIVRRGIVLASEPFESDAETLYQMELSVIEDGEDWLVDGRVWKADGKRPKKVMISHRAITAELLFPLAGRPVLIGTPFSGEAVQFASAAAYYGEFVDGEEKPEKKKSENEPEN